MSPTAGASSTVTMPGRASPISARGLSSEAAALRWLAPRAAAMIAMLTRLSPAPAAARARARFDLAVFASVSLKTSYHQNMVNVQL
jgi:hypothetical protein